MNLDSTKSISAFIKFAPYVVVIMTTAAWAFGALATHRGWLCSLINFGSLDHLEDTFAPVNVYFTGISGLGIIATLIFQSIQMKEAKKDAAENIKRLDEQLEESKKQFHLEQFKSTFFNLLSIHRNNAERLSSFSHHNQGISDFTHFINTVHRKVNESETSCTNNVIHYLNEQATRHTNAEKTLLDYYINYYLKANDTTIIYYIFESQQMGNRLKPYFRHLYHLIKFTDKILNNDENNRRLYMGIIRAQFEPHEHIALFYNALYFADTDGETIDDSNQPRSKFKALIERNHLLHEMDESLLIKPEHVSYYSPSAYGDNNGETTMSTDQPASTNDQSPSTN